MAGMKRQLVFGLTLAGALVGRAGLLSAGPDAAPAPEDTPAQAPPRVVLEDAPQPFVPLHPRTVEDRKRVEALQDYVEARALEDRKHYSEAIDKLKAALQQEPDSVAILRRLCRLYFGQGEPDKAISVGRRALEVDPNDPVLIRQLVAYYQRHHQPAAAESLLIAALANPKLAKPSGAYLLIEHDLGLLYAGPLARPAKAADALERVVTALDDPAANKLSFGEQKLILGDDESESYLQFGEVFLRAKRFPDAARAFDRGLVYDPGHPLLPIRLAEAQLESGKPAAALDTIERYLKQQPQGREAFELLRKILAALHKEDEYLPRLEAAARADAKNYPLQFALAEAYRNAGQKDKADALFRRILDAQPEPQAFQALAASLLKDHRTEELIRLLGDALEKPMGAQAVIPQIRAIINDPEYAKEVLATGLKMLNADPPRLDKAGRDVLGYIAQSTRQFDTLVTLHRQALKANPSPQTYRELAQALREAHRFGEAARTYEEMLEKFPGSRNAQTLIELSSFRLMADRDEDAVAAAREALKLEPQNPDLIRIGGYILSRAGKADEAIPLVREVLKNDPADEELNRLMGYLLTQAGKDDEAIAFYKSLLERYPDEEELFKLAHSGLSIIYVNRDELAKGESELEAVLEKFPEDVGVNNDLGYLYADQGKHLEKAETMIRKAIKTNPGPANSAYLDSLGWVLFKRGKVKEAVEPLEQAVQLSSDPDATIYDHLGDVYFELHDYAKAKDLWKKAEATALKAHPPDKRLGPIRKKLEALEKLKPPPRAATGDTP